MATQGEGGTYHGCCSKLKLGRLDHNGHAEQSQDAICADRVARSLRVLLSRLCASICILCREYRLSTEFQPIAARKSTIGCDHPPLCISPRKYDRALSRAFSDSCLCSTSHKAHTTYSIQINLRDTRASRPHDDNLGHFRSRLPSLSSTNRVYCSSAMTAAVVASAIPLECVLIRCHTRAYC